jgi:2'-5' RNA ligase
MRTTQDVDHVKNHWWWRPGWRTGRHFYACHITFEDEPAVRDLAAFYQEPLKALSGLDLIPPSWLHLTMQGIGFTDEISASEIGEVTAAISSHLTNVPRPRVTFDRPTVQPEAIYIPATPADAIDQVRNSVHEAIREVLGSERSPDSDIIAALESYRPHMSIAYINSSGPARPYIEALREASHHPVCFNLRTVSVLTFHRDNHMYEWTNSIPVAIGR